MSTNTPTMTNNDTPSVVRGYGTAEWHHNDMIDRGEFPFVPPIFKRNSPSPRKRSRSPSPMLLIPLTQPSAKRAMANILPLSPPPTPPPTDNDGNGDTEPGESKVKNIRLSRTHALMRLSKNIQAEIDDSPPSYEMAEAIKSSSNAADHGVWNDDIGEFLPAAELSPQAQSVRTALTMFDEHKHPENEEILYDPPIHKISTKAIKSIISFQMMPMIKRLAAETSNGGLVAEYQARLMVGVHNALHDLGYHDDNDKYGPSDSPTYSPNSHSNNSEAEVDEAEILKAVTDAIGAGVTPIEA